MLQARSAIALRVWCTFDDGSRIVFNRCFFIWVQARSRQFAKSRSGSKREGSLKAPKFNGAQAVRPTIYRCINLHGLHVWTTIVVHLDSCRQTADAGIALLWPVSSSETPMLPVQRSAPLRCPSQEENLHNVCLHRSWRHAKYYSSPVARPTGSTALQLFKIQNQKTLKQYAALLRSFSVGGKHVRTEGFMSGVPCRSFPI